MRAALLLSFVASAVHAQTVPAPFPVRNVPETFFGTVVDDPYRDLEDTKNAAVIAWAKAQADYARGTLDALPGYRALRARLTELEDSRASTIGNVERLGNGITFFTRRGAQDNTFKLYRRDAGGKEALLVDPDAWEKETGKPHAINYFVPSPNGEFVAFGISAAGSEDASIYVIETATRKKVGAPISRSQYPEISWRPDSRAFFFLRQQEMKPGMAPTEKYQNGRVWLHVVGTSESADTVAVGMGLSPRLTVRPADMPFVTATPGSRYGVAVVANGVQREVAIYTAPLAAIGRPGTPWVKVCDFPDKVVSAAVHGEDIYLLTHRDSTRYSIVRTRLGAPDFAKATVVVPPSDRVLLDLRAAKDGLYIEARDGAVKRLMRRAWGAHAAADVRTPEGRASLLAARPDADGVVFGLVGWVRARQIYSVDRPGKVANTGLQPQGPFDAPAGYTVKEVTVKSHDGANVPLSIVHRADLKLDGSNPTLLYGYGAYGITEEPSYLPTRLAWLERGGVFAVANVRGSGVYGEDWYKAGYKSTKPNTWKDFIACAQYLIAQNYTTAKRLGILGGSAGGILVGRAMTERPDLFGAVVSLVGALDTVRAETTANGVPNIPEFGTVKKEDEFRALLAMSSYHHVKDGTAYPAVLLIHGVNDPRVEYWESSKMAARLQAATASGKPVLLDLDFDAGHGIGSTKLQRLRNAADYYSFLLWQAGHPEFQRH